MNGARYQTPAWGGLGVNVEIKSSGREGALESTDVGAVAAGGIGNESIAVGAGLASLVDADGETDALVERGAARVEGAGPGRAAIVF